MPAPTLPHVSPELAHSTREFFQPLYRRRLSDDDGRDIATNVLGAFAVLREMKRNRDAELLAAASAPAPVPPPPVAVRPRRRLVRSPSVKP